MEGSGLSGDPCCSGCRADHAQLPQHVTKSLLHYYKGLAAIETSSAKSTMALTDVIQVPYARLHLRVR